jgi:hypothetical protein
MAAEMSSAPPPAARVEREYWVFLSPPEASPERIVLRETMFSQPHALPVGMEDIWNYEGGEPSSRLNRQDGRRNFSEVSLWWGVTVGNRVRSNKTQCPNSQMSN